MDKAFIVFLLIGGIFFYFVMGLVEDTQTEEERSTISKQEELYEQYRAFDSIGQEILDVTSANTATQLKAWNASQIKVEFLEIFPDFDTMRGFVKNRVRGEPLVQKLTKKINEVEDKFFSGTMNAEQAKRALGQL